MRRSVAASAALASASVLLVAPSAAAPLTAAPICDGKPATIATDGDRHVQGTSGADVIVAVDARTVHAKGGDDTICVLTGIPFASGVETYPGPGADVVDLSGVTKAHTVTDLGAGPDRFQGSAQHDFVDTGDLADLAAGQAASHDEVRTGRDFDIVFSGTDPFLTTTVGDAVNDDTLRLGPGGDVATVAGTPTGEVKGGGGVDSVHLMRTSPTSWRVDAAAGSAQVGAGLAWVLAEFETYLLSRLPWTSFEFLGTDANEVLSTEAVDDPVPQGPLHARLGGGRDYVAAYASDAGELSGGPGSDGLTLLADAALTDAVEIDLRRGTLGLNGGEPTAARSFRDVWVTRLAVVRIVGDGADNDLRAKNVCRAILIGGGGDDLLEPGVAGIPRCAKRGLVADVTSYGRRGNDRLYGSHIDDRLLGGRGRDTASGGRGNDVCVAEVRTQCERPQ